MIKPKLYGLGQDGAVGRKFKRNILDFFDNMYWRIWQNSKRLNQYRQCQSLDDCNFSKIKRVLDPDNYAP
jgi:hypothetical protein